MSGRHRQVMCALHLSTGAAVESVNQWRRSNLFTKGVVKGMELYGVLSFRSSGMLLLGQMNMH